MKIGLLLNSNNRLNSQSEKYKEILLQKNIPFVIIDPNSISFPGELEKCSHLLFQHTQGDTDMLIYDAIFNIAQNVYHIKCYPNYETFWPYENKIKEYYLLKSHNFPVIDSHVFWNHNHAVRFLQKTSFPLIAKLPKGAGSSNVILINSFREGMRITNQVFKKGVRPHRLKSKSNLASLSNVGIINYVKSMLKVKLIGLGIINDKTNHPEWQVQKDAILFQKYLPNNSFDTRITVIGKRAFAFRRFVRKDDFRASGSGNFNTEPEKIDPRCLEIAFNVSNKLNFNTMAYDFLFDEEEKPLISEISYCFVDWIVQSCPGYWDENLNWHGGHLWPQQCQLEDFLQTP